MFKKILASVGIGAAKVDTQLISDQLAPGDTFQAEIVMQGGKVEQDISGLQLSLMTEVEVESDEGEYHQNFALQSWEIPEATTLAPGEKKVIPFSATIHPETPITAVQCRRNKTKVWIQTGLEIDLGLDASDRDYLTILPTPAMRHFLEAMQQCGYSLYEADVEKGYLQGNGFQSQSGAYQELEFKPDRGGLFGIKEVEVSFISTPPLTHAILEIDQTFASDTCRSLSWDETTPVDQLVATIQQTLS